MAGMLIEVRCHSFDGDLLTYTKRLTPSGIDKQVNYAQNRDDFDAQLSFSGKWPRLSIESL
jgi:hypothetical protein